MTEILPGLWLGNTNACMNTVFLRDKQIRCIINCSTDIPFNKYFTNCETIRLPIDDNPKTDSYMDNMKMYDNLENIVVYIHEQLSKNHNVLIFCNNGFQRSAAVISGYIIKYGKVSLKQTEEYLQSKREKCFNPNNHFYFSLQKFFHNLNN